MHKSELIVKYQHEMIDIIEKSVADNPFEEGHTWAYNKYNFFGMVSATPLFYDLYCELKDVVWEYVGGHRRLWMQSWLNYHMPGEVLKWHTHEWPIHGYISSRPHKTRTVFEDHKVINEVGNIYIGPGHQYHKVEVDEDFDTPRITIGFDLLTEDCYHLNSNLGLMPFPR